MSAQLTAGWVEDWARVYEQVMGPREEDALDAGEQARLAGHYTKEQALLVVRWKSARVVWRFKTNSEADVMDVTRLMAEAPGRLKHRVLTLLSGVGVPVAGALLTAWDPESFTMYDWRALEAHERITGGVDRPRDLTYHEFNVRSRDLAEALEVTLRSLDRALWAWSKRSYEPR